LVQFAYRNNFHSIEYTSDDTFLHIHRLLIIIS
jgi:hypothetical protein